MSGPRRPRIGDTRDARHEVVFTSRDHVNARGVPKAPLTLQRAEQIVRDHNGALYGDAYRRCRLAYYVCSQCHQYHVGHVAPPVAR